MITVQVQNIIFNPLIKYSKQYKPRTSSKRIQKGIILEQLNK